MGQPEIMTDWWASHWRMTNDGLAKFTDAPTTAKYKYVYSSVNPLWLTKICLNLMLCLPVWL